MTEPEMLCEECDNVAGVECLDCELGYCHECYPDHECEQLEGEFDDD